MGAGVLRAGQVVGGRYRIDTVIARGGMADVFRAQDTATDAIVAVKALRAADDLERFRIEADALELVTHPGIVALRDVGEHEGVSYIVMDHVDGRSLRDVIRGDGPLDSEDVGRIGGGLAAALAHAHAHGVVHRDVKPANILVDGDGQPHLADFGIARLGDMTGLTKTGMTMGTAAYLAPEQVEGKAIGGTADVYSLGLVLLEAFTGTPAFEGSTAEAVLARLHRDPEVPDHLPEEWSALLRAMTAREPARRPTAGLVAAALATGTPDLSALRDTEVTATLPVLEDDLGAGAAAGVPARGLRRYARLSFVIAVAAAGLLAILAIQPAGLGEEEVADDDPIGEVTGDEPTQVAEEAEESETADEEAGGGGGSGSAGPSSGGDHPQGGPPGRSRGGGRGG